MKDKPFFEASDFNIHEEQCLSVRDAVDLANNKLYQALGPVVFTNENNDHPLDKDQFWNIRRNSHSTTQARLFNIQLIEKPKCDHIPGAKIFSSSDCEGRIEVIAESFSPICAKCGVKLQATWQEVKS